MGASQLRKWWKVKPSQARLKGAKERLSNCVKLGG
jgi:hypothetical protein